MNVSMTSSSSIGTKRNPAIQPVHKNTRTNEEIREKNSKPKSNHSKTVAHIGNNIGHNLEKNEKLQPPFRLYKDMKKKTVEEGLSSVASILSKSHNILVLAGAGLSVSCGIPDFRSKGTGLYSTLDAQGLGLSCAEDLFDLETFMENPLPFYKFAKSLYPGTIHPSPSHYFISLLEQKKKLLRVYTQNIDGLEEVAGITKRKIICAHGSMNWAQCMKCGVKVNSNDIQKDVMQGSVPRCQKMKLNKNKKKQNTLKTKKRKISGSDDQHIDLMVPSNNVPQTKLLEKPRSRRSSTKRLASSTWMDDNNSHNYNAGNMSSIREQVQENDGSQEPICDGIIKPGVTFFGEKLDGKVSKSLVIDKLKVDAVIVIGTSLSVAPMSKVIEYLPLSVPRILINKNHLSSPSNGIKSMSSDSDDKDFRNGYLFDACLLGNCDNVTRSLIEQLGWDNEFEKLYSISTKINPPIISTDAKLCEYKGNAIYMERTILFEGAHISTSDKNGDELIDTCDASDFVENLTVLCDGCSKDVSGTIIMKCTVCFDFDLCRQCFRHKSKSHFEGKHKFMKEGC